MSGKESKRGRQAARKPAGKRRARKPAGKRDKPARKGIAARKPGERKKKLAVSEPLDEVDALETSLMEFGELVSAFEEAERAIDTVFGEGDGGDGAAPPAPASASQIESTLDDIFAEFQGDEALEAPADEAGEVTRRYRKKAEHVVGNLVRMLTSKREVSPDDLELVFEITKRKLIQEVEAEAITFFLAKPDGIHFAHVAYARSLYRGDREAEARFRRQIEKLKQTVLPPGTGIVGKVIASGRSYVTLNAPQDKNFFEGISRSTGFPIHSMMTVPIRYEQKTYGAIQLLNKRVQRGDPFFNRRDLSLAEEVAEYSARALYLANNPGHAWPPVDVARYVARLARAEFLELDHEEVDPKLLQLLGEETLRKFRIVPLKKLGTRAIKAATDNPLDVHRRENFQIQTGLEIEVLVVSPAPQIDRAIDRVFPRSGAASSVRDAFIADLEEKAKQTEKVDLQDGAKEDSAPVIKLVNSIIEDAFARGASDIHIEPFEKEVQVRYRTDGVLREVMQLPKSAIRSLTARLKIMSELDISEQRLPQDGRIRYKEFSRSGLDIDLRIATAPMIWGEKTVMRILDKTSAMVGVDKLGYSEHNLKLYLACVEAPYGMILHTGPTGSGKTTSLYAALDYCNEPDLNIQTAEDPVEYVMHGINQMQMRQNIGLTFSRALRCYLRQDPDIILVGEIRDLETAQIAVEAALTGHQVFSTLHTNDAAGTVTRLVEMGIEPFLITGSLLCVCSQRLMRRLCPRCRQPHEPTDEERGMLKIEDGEEVELFRAHPDGCPRCNQTGYKGRLGAHELLVMNEAVRAVAARHGVTGSEIHRVAVEEADLIPLFDDAMGKVKQGITDIAEALRNVKKV